MPDEHIPYAQIKVPQRSEYLHNTEVLDWWHVTEVLARTLIARGETIISNDAGCWWGRIAQSQCCDELPNELIEELV